MSILSLKNQSEFEYVNLSGSRFRHALFTIVVKHDATLTDDNTCFFYLGMKVGKKLGNAVIRNKIKRRIRHIIREIYRSCGSTKNNKRIVLVPKKNFDKTNFAKLYKDISNIILA